MNKPASPKQLSQPLVVVSDIHLKNLQDARGSLLLDLIRRLDTTQVEYFVLLGDIFDFCLGSHRYFRKKFAPLGEALSQLAAKGVEVLFFEGNHEFAIRSLKWSGVKFITEDRFSITLKNGARVAMCHGDLMAPNAKYLMFRSIVKSKFATSLSSLVPGKILDAYALTHSQISRMRHEDAEQVHAQVQKGLDEWMDETSADHYLFGHFHIPYAEPLPDGSYFVSLDSWDLPNALLLNEQQEWQRTFLKKPDGAFEIQSANPIKEGR